MLQNLVRLSQGVNLAVPYFRGYWGSWEIFAKSKDKVNKEKKDVARFFS